MNPLSKRFARKTLIGLSASLFFLTSFTPLSAGSLAGSYLAASQANFDNNHQEAADYYASALAADPSNTQLMQNLLFAYIAVGEVDKSLPVARRMESVAAGSQLARLMLLTESINSGDFDTAHGFLDEGAAFSPLLDGLIKGWIYLGQGRMSQATAQFDELSEANGMTVFSLYHKSLALAMVGDFEGADKILAGEDGQPLRINRGSLIAHVQMMSQLDRNAEAIELVDSVLNGARDAEFMDIRNRLQAGETLPYTFITTAEQGAAEVFFTLASILSGEENDRFALTYGRLAEYLRPQSVDAILLVAEMLSDQGQHDLAVRSYNKVPADHPIFYTAEIGRAEALIAADKPDAAIEVLRGLTNSHSDIPTVFVSLGDALRQQSQFAEATVAYSAAIDLLPEPAANQWFLYYARGITFEREGLWDKAEADFRYSLELAPDQPLVLNYLGYGLVEKRMKLAEAQEMIEKAVAARPNDGYITDSLGWVLYRIEKFEEAVPYLERATELMPVDPIITDHLGDVYWMVGRKREADFQWHRALSFEPEEKDAERIRLKLEIGLDQVLEMESKTAGSDDN